MKALVWKEWRENRLLIVWAIALMLVVLFGDVTYDLLSHSIRIEAQELQAMTVFVWFVSALLCGSSMLSPEIGSGSLQFLSILPVSRARIWCTKLASGLCLLAACLLASWLATMVFCGIAELTGFVTPSGNEPIGAWLGYYGFTLPLFVTGFLVGTLIDRTISALMASMVVVALLTEAITLAETFVVGLFQGPVGGSEPWAQIFITIVALVTVALAAISYKIFTQGETLRTSKRFVILAGCLAPPLALVAACAIGWLIIMA